jgi:hypothetical protein
LIEQDDFDPGTSALDTAHARGRSLCAAAERLAADEVIPASLPAALRNQSDTGGLKPPKKKFKAYPIGFPH